MKNPWPANGLDKADRPDRGANRTKPPAIPLTGWLSGDTRNIGRNTAKHLSGTRRRIADRLR